MERSEQEGKEGEKKMVEDLERATRSCMEGLRYQSAAFYAEKLWRLRGTDADAFRLAECYYRSEQYKRAIQVGQTEGAKALAFRHLLGLCMVKCKQYEECIELLGDEPMPEEEFANLPLREKQMYANVCKLRGDTMLQLESRYRAKFWYLEALYTDPTVVHVFETLMSESLLSAKEETDLVRRLQKAPGSLAILQLYYETSVACHGPPTHTLPQEGVAKSGDFQWKLAQRHYYTGEMQKAYSITVDILEDDPYHPYVRELHIAVLFELDKRRELFLFAHNLVENNPDDHISWYAVGCYYMLLLNFEQARRYFSKAMSIRPQYGLAWIACGHTYSAKDEEEQALSAYRLATQILPGSHIPKMCVGVQLLRSEKAPRIAEAHDILCLAKDLSIKDPLVHNELGVAAYFQQRYEDAVSSFGQALELILSDGVDEGTLEVSVASLPARWEPIISNLAHAYRHLQRWKKAIIYYRAALVLQPRNPTIYASIGFSYHQSGNLEKAIDYYHQSLGLETNESKVTADLLDVAVSEWYEFGLV